MLACGQTFYLGNTILKILKFGTNVWDDMLPLSENQPSPVYNSFLVCFSFSPFSVKDFSELLNLGLLHLVILLGKIRCIV